MPRPIMPPRLIRWAGDWHIFTTDPFTKKQSRVNCKARGARTAAERREMLSDYTRTYEDKLAEQRRGGKLTDYDANLRDAINRYLADVAERALLRERRDGEGLAPSSARRIREIVGAFHACVPVTMKTAELDTHTLLRWFRSVAVDKSSATVNTYRRTLRACFKWLASERPKLFPDPEALWPAFRQSRVEPRAAVAYSPDELRAFMESLPPMQQRAFRFLALTGCRAGEMLAAELIGDVVVFRAQKTMATRYVPLIGAPEATIAPSLLAELREHGIPRRYNRKVWTARGDIRPQKLRRNWVSYCASIGVPLGVAALWAGHSAAVAERYYRQTVLKRLPGASLESAMGL